MSKILYIDTTVKSKIGLLDPTEGFLEFIENNTQKPSSSFHRSIYELLEKFNLSLKDLECVFQMAGPGSYTGMRLSEGFCQILELEDIEIYSTFHFKIPKLFGVKNYTFISNAFKKELFVAQSEDGIIKKDLITTANFNEYIGELYSHEVFEEYQVKNTTDLIKNNPNIILDVIAEKTKESIYYYRPIENEFKMKEKAK